MPSAIHPRSRCLTSLVLLVSAAAPAQVEWRQAPLLEGRTAHAMAYDAARQRVVLFGGSPTAATSGDTWEWDGVRWQLREPAVRPPGRLYHSMAYDAVRGRVVMFGGLRVTSGGSTYLGDTWEWDGTTWQQRAATSAPAPRADTALFFDVSMSRVVLFGGRGTASATFDDTWTWDGALWRKLRPRTKPPSASADTAVYDSARARGIVVCYGTPLEVWEWSGTNWSKRVAATSPPPRFAFGLAYDAARQRTILFGGTQNQVDMDDTWEWDGVTWTKRVTAVAPFPRVYVRMAYDAARARIVLCGGWITPKNFIADTWEWDGQAWSLRAPSAAPVARWGPALVFDPALGRTLLFGGSRHSTRLYADLWHWDGLTWTEQGAATAPPPRENAGLAYDRARGRVVLFGGAYVDAGSAYVGRDDTWEWDGAAWTQMQPAVRPPGTFVTQPRLVYLERARRSLLFTGSQTWEWNGTTWTQRTPPVSPPPRSAFSLAYDSARDRAILFGGYNGVPLRDTWEWDGTTWLPRASMVMPPARYHATLVYDSWRRRTVLFAGAVSSTAYLSDTWEWDGTSWHRRSTAVTPGGRAQYGACFDDVRGKTVLFGGVDPLGQLGDTWLYATTAPGAYAAFGSGCAGSVGTPSLLPLLADRPWLGTQFTLELQDAPTSTARALALGTSRTRWGSLPLPFDLAAIGAAGCSILASLEVLLPYAGTTVSLAIPDTPWLVGQHLLEQAIVLDPGANPLGVTVSNAGTSTIGAK